MRGEASTRSSSFFALLSVAEMPTRCGLPERILRTIARVSTSAMPTTPCWSSQVFRSSTDRKLLATFESSRTTKPSSQQRVLSPSGTLTP